MPASFLSSSPSPYNSLRSNALLTPLVTEESPLTPPPCRLWLWLAEAFRVDLTPGNLASQSLCNNLLVPTREQRAAAAIGSGDPCSEGELRAAYGEEGQGPAGDGAVLVMKLALALFASGMPSYVADPLLHSVADAMLLPRMHLIITMRSVQVSFGGGPVHICSCRQGKVLYKLTDLYTIALGVATSDSPDPLKALASIDEVNTCPSNYGPAVEALAYHGFAIFGSQAIFDGSQEDLLLVALSSIPVRLTLTASGGSRTILLPAVVGFSVHLLSRCALGLDTCHSTTAFLSLLLFELPGSELLFGASEVKRGAMVGVTRLLNAVVTTMFMAVSLSAGWSAAAPLVSRFAPQEGDPYDPWTIPAEVCPQQASASLGEALLRRSTHLLPLGLCFFVLVGIRPTNIPLPLICVVATLLLSGCLPLLTELPLDSYVSNAISLFVGANLSYLHEYFSPTGLSHQAVQLPITVLLAPGAGAFRAVVQAIDAASPGGSPAGPPGDALFQLMMQGVSFAIGEKVAHSLWASALSRRASSRATATAICLSNVRSVCPVKLAKVQTKMNAAQ
mmetsp:Transcript_22/g.60  ORF Transcript_22/g.60 Transcript_22/m.60 type:complete len:562 (+) Transcript_22:402-2087(+)